MLILSLEDTTQIQSDLIRISTERAPVCDIRLSRRMRQLPVLRPPIHRVFAPFSFLPQQPLSLVLAKTLDQLLAPQRAQGDLDFLDGRVFGVELRQTPVRLAVTLHNGHVVCAHGKKTDASVAAELGGFLALLGQREDPDTLFFRRELMMRGDTDLGLQVKNLLDQIDPLTLPVALTRLLSLCDRIVQGLEGRSDRQLTV